MNAVLHQDPTPRAVSQDDWLAARRALLEREKHLTRLQDELSAARRELPWLRIATHYEFDTPDGRRSLSDLFAGRSQLIVKHFMLSADTDICVGCSFELDHIEGALVHLQHHDVSVVAVSRAPLAQIEAAKQRMGWRIPWASSLDSRFNYDFHVSFSADEIARGPVFYNFALQDVGIQDVSGFSVFFKDADGVIHLTYSTFGRGAEYVLGSYVLLDMTPKGRNENGPGFNLTDWVRPHDRYDSGGHVDGTGQYRPSSESCGCS